MRDILERVAVGDDVSELSDLSDSDEEEWTAANNAAPDDASDDDEPDFFCGTAEEIQKTAKPRSTMTFTGPDFIRVHKTAANRFQLPLHQNKRIMAAGLRDTTREEANMVAGNTTSIPILHRILQDTRMDRTYL
ncbi:hypothetical protein MTO96_029268 [Rhipicephalus appendiculatus]